MTEANQYRMVGGLYELCDSEGAVGGTINQIAMVIDAEAGVLIKHGSPALIDPWYAEFRERTRAREPEKLEYLMLLTGRIPVEQINRCIREPAYAGTMWRLIQEGLVGEQPGIA